MDDDGHGTSAAARRSGEPIRRARRPVDESRSLRCHCASSDAGVATWEYERPGVALADKQQIARAKLRRVAAARSPAGLRLPCARRRRRSASISHPAHTPGASSAPSMPLRSAGRRLAPFSTSKRLTTSPSLPPLAARASSLACSGPLHRILPSSPCCLLPPPSPPPPSLMALQSRGICSGSPGAASASTTRAPHDDCGRRGGWRSIEVEKRPNATQARGIPYF